MFGSSFLAFVQLSIIFSLSLFSEGLSRSENNGPTLDNIFDIRPSEKGNIVVSGSISPTFYEQILRAQIPKAQKRLTA